MNKISNEIKICIIIGDPVNHSLSPAMHNKAYEAAGLGDKYIFLPIKVGENNLKNAVQAIRTFGIHGTSVTMPHKEKIVRFLDNLDSSAKAIGAVNTVVNKNGILTGYNTDWLGVTKPLMERTVLKGKKVAVIGAGGVARAAIFGLKKEGADITVFNRTLSKAKKLANIFKCDFSSLKEINLIENFDIIINATSLGMKVKSDGGLIPEKFLNDKQVIFDLIYKPKKTKLIQNAEKKGAKIIFGYEMLLHQGMEQFFLYTGSKAPKAHMLDVLIRNL
jgi:shikimate dehydrogenase